MISVAATFQNAVMSLHVYCIFVLYPGQEISAEPWFYTFDLVQHIIGTLMIIYYSSSLMNEVNKYSFILGILYKTPKLYSSAGETNISDSP